MKKTPGETMTWTRRFHIVKNGRVQSTTEWEFTDCPMRAPYTHELWMADAWCAVRVYMGDVQFNAVNRHSWKEIGNASVD